MEDPERFWAKAAGAAIKSGSVLGSRLHPKLDLPHELGVDAWKRAPRVPAEALCRAIMKSALKARRDGLIVAGAVITGSFDLHNSNIPFGITFVDCYFESTPILNGAVIESIVFDGSVLPGLDANGLRVRSSVALERSQFNGLVDADGLSVGTQVSIQHCSFFNYAGVALSLDSSHISHSVVLDHVEVAGELSMFGTTAEAGLYMGDSVFNNPTGKSLDLDQLQTSTNVIIMRSSFNGQFSLSRAHVGGQFATTNSDFSYPLGVAVNLAGSEIVDKLVLIACTIRGEVRSSDIQVGGDIHFTAEFRNAGGVAMNLDTADVKGSLTFSKSLFEGELRIVGATVGSQLRMDGTSFINPLGDAVLLDGCDVRREFGFNNVEVVGNFRMLGSTVGGQASSRNGRFTSSDSYPVYFDHSRFKASLLIDDAYVSGELRVCGATVGGQLAIRRTILFNPGATCLRLQGTTVSSTAVIAPTQVRGEIDLVDTSFEARLTYTAPFHSSHFENKIDASGGQFHSLVIHRSPTQPNARLALDLRRAKIGTLSLGGAESVRLLNAVGWEIRTVVGRLLVSRDSALDLLRTAPFNPGAPFVEQPWSALATAIEDSGRPETGRRLRLRAAWRRTQSSPMRTRVSQTIYGALVGHGYYPHFLIAWLVGIYLVTAAITNFYAGDFVPTDWRYAQQSELSGSLEAEYPEFNSSLFAVDVVVPASNVGQSQSWRLDDRPLVTLILGGLKGLSWILTALLIAGFTGLLRKR